MTLNYSVAAYHIFPYKTLNNDNLCYKYPLEPDIHLNSGLIFYQFNYRFNNNLRLAFNLSYFKLLRNYLELYRSNLATIGRV